MSRVLISDIVTLILSSGDMSLCPDDRGRPHDDRDKSGTQIDVPVHSDCLAAQSQTHSLVVQSQDQLLALD